ncbi:unnamed protein product [Choristocarpus tenellus]
MPGEHDQEVQGSISDTIVFKVPFFSGHAHGDEGSVSALTSHLNRRLEGYHEDLVKTVERLDAIINNIQGAQVQLNTATGGRESADFDGLTKKMRLKLEGIPCRWQVNADVLAWLLRPIPFVTALPAPGQATGIRGADISPDESCMGTVKVSEGRIGKQSDVFSSRSTRNSNSIPGSELAPVPEQVWDPGLAGGANSDHSSPGLEAGSEPSNSGIFHSYDGVYQASLVLTHLLRDWTDEGEFARKSVYGPLLRVLDESFGIPGEQQPDSGNLGKRGLVSVLVPGAGLGRLAVEIAARGYASVQANELSPTMLTASYWVLDALGYSATCNEGCWSAGSPGWPEIPVLHTTQGEDGEHRNGLRSGEGTESFYFFPFLHDAPLNEMDGEGRFRAVRFPDTGARNLLSHASGRLSFQAGEFLSTYSHDGAFSGTFNAVVTSFFIDTAPNIIEYIATIRRVLRQGGLWINCGPLHWHEHARLALSLDEILALVRGFGFRVEGLEQLPVGGYRSGDGKGGDSMRVEGFRPVLWVATLDGSGG